MLAVLMLTLTEDLEGSLSSYTMMPLKSPKRPGTVLIIMCFTVKRTEECTGSILYSSAANAELHTTSTANRGPTILRICIRSSLLGRCPTGVLHWSGMDQHRIQDI